MSRPSSTPGGGEDPLISILEACIYSHAFLEIEVLLLRIYWSLLYLLSFSLYFSNFGPYCTLHAILTLGCYIKSFLSSALSLFSTLQKDAYFLHCHCGDCSLRYTNIRNAGQTPPSTKSEQPQGWSDGQPPSHECYQSPVASRLDSCKLQSHYSE